MAIHTPKTRDELTRLLAPLRLQAATFQRAVEVAAADSRSFSRGAPRSAPEGTRWFRMVEKVHEELMLLREGWRRSDPNNLPYFRQTEIGIGLIVSSGDHLTGVTWGDPTTRNPKGRETGRRVEDNAQEGLFELDGPDGDPERDDLWICLYDERDGMVHLELSRPAAMSGGRISGWSDRIIFPVFDLAIGDFSFEDADDEGDLGFTLARR